MIRNGLPTDHAARVHSNQDRLASSLRRHYDVIVCGAGTSGCVIASRLAADPRVSVLLLEAGGSDDTELVSNPNLWPRTLGSDLDWNHRTEANPRLDGRAIPYSMGRVLGGGSSINVCTWSRGHQADWDHYAAETREDAWSYKSVLDIYRSKIEAWSGAPDPEFRGEHGMVYVRPAQDCRPFSHALLQGAAGLGLPAFPDPNGRMMQSGSGCSFVDETIQGDERRSIYRSYAYPLMDRPNLTVLTGAMVTRVLFDGRRATGVSFDYRGASIRADANHEVVLSLGAVQTPKLLMLSGIGAEGELKSAGIPVLQALPGVGRNLHDHIAIGLVWASQPDVLPSIPRSQTACFWKTDPGLDSPNAYCYARAGAAVTPENAVGIAAPAMTWSLMMGMRPRSRGSVHLTGSAPSDPARIDPNYLADRQDMEDLKTGYHFAREIGNSGSLRPFAVHEVTPDGSAVAALEEYLRRGLVTFWHQSGTARMGLDAMSVVDGRLKVHGIEHLRIADASVMPRVTSGNTMAPCVVIGEQAAAFMTLDMLL